MVLQGAFTEGELFAHLEEQYGAEVDFDALPNGGGVEMVEPMPRW